MTNITFLTDITFYNVWRTTNADDRAALLGRMREEAPALAAKPGFVSMTALECAADGRVLVEGRWQSEDAFKAAVADDPEAQRSRASLEAFGSPEPGLFIEVFRVLPASANERASDPASDPAHAVISAGSGNVTYVQVWRMRSAEHQERWLEAMHSHIGLLTEQPGFVSMSLHTSLDGKQTAVYAQWSDESAWTAAITLPEAKRSHEDMARWGTANGSLYRVDSVYLPGMPSQAHAPQS